MTICLPARSAMTRVYVIQVTAAPPQSYLVPEQSQRECHPPPPAAPPVPEPAPDAHADPGLAVEAVDVGPGADRQQGCQRVRHEGKCQRIKLLF